MDWHQQLLKDASTRDDELSGKNHRSSPPKEANEIAFVDTRAEEHESTSLSA